LRFWLAITISDLCGQIDTLEQPARCFRQKSVLNEVILNEGKSEASMLQLDRFKKVPKR
jgi:hypothetical protein